MPAFDRFPALADYRARIADGKRVIHQAPNTPTFALVVHGALVNPSQDYNFVHTPESSFYAKVAVWIVVEAHSQREERVGRCNTDQCFLDQLTFLQTLVSHAVILLLRNLFGNK